MDMTNTTGTVTLGKTMYRIEKQTDHTLALIGKRGGSSSMTRNINQPDMWAHITMAGLRARTQWYRRTSPGHFEAV